MSVKINTSDNPNLFESILMLGKMLNLSRSVATVFAVIYSVDQPVSMEQIVDHSSLSKSAVSLALRELMQMNAVQEKAVLGERCRYYVGQPDLSAVVVHIIVSRLKYPLSELRDKLDDLSDAQTRSCQLRDLVDTADQTLAMIQADQNH